MVRSFLVFLVAFSSFGVIAKDFGVNAATYPVVEEGMVAMIKRKLNALDLKAEQEKLEKIVKQRIDSPTPVAELVHAKESRTFSVDPSYVLAEDVYLPDGKLLYASGTKVNPLDHIDWQQKLIFIDGSSQAQIDWALAEYLSGKESREPIKIILVAGSPEVVAQELSVQVYFDQFGELVSKFKIKATPAVVEKDNLELKVSEFKI